MSHNIGSLHSLRRVFQDGFSVHDIAEPLVSFDASTPAADVRAFMEANRFEIVGVREQGIVSGFVELGELGEGACGDAMGAIDESRLIEDSEPLVNLVLRLRDCQRLFVSVFGKVGGIVSRTDLQKPAVRMWLFGMVTLIEMRFGWMIEQHTDGEDWKQWLSAGRIEKAESLLAERMRRNQDLSLLDCLQLSDKTQIIARDQRLRSMTRFESRRQVENLTAKLERLRNNLAHAQDIVSTDWETIVIMSEHLDRILEGPPGLRPDAQATE